MELAGLGIGVAGLAGLFSTCIDCFKLIQQGRYLGKDYVLLETKFSNQKLRLATWGRACGMMDPEGYDTRLDDEGLRPCIEATLTQLFQLFKDGKQLKKKYGLKEDQGGQRARPFLGAGLELERLSATSYGQKFQELMNRTKKIQQGARLRDSGMWAIEDKSKFTELVQHLKDLIDDLEGLTRYLDVGDRQRDMIQAEVESIAEFDILENIEEARLGRIDAVSDAASLQLWKLRDQFLIGGKTAEGSKQTRMDEVSAASSDKEWDVLPGQNESVGTVGDEMRYQVLHRVRCANEVAALIFLDKPSYLAGQQHEDQWAFLDPDKPTQEEQINHLRGRRNIPSLEAYRQQNRQLQFVVLHEYRCCDILPVSRIIPPPPTGQCVRLLSEELCAALRGVRKTSGELSLYPDFKVDLELQAPYMWFYQSRMLFLHTNDVNSVYQESIRAFAGVICGLMEPEYAKVDVLLARKAISWRYLLYIFFPGSIILVPNTNENIEHNRAYQQRTWPIIAKTQEAKAIELAVKSWEFDGKFYSTGSTLSISRSQFPGDKDAEINICDLPVFPLKYATANEKRALERRGQMFWSCRYGRYIFYTGSISASERIEKGRFMIDIAMYKRMFPSSNVVRNNDRLSNELGDELMARDCSPEEDFELLLPSTIHGFDMQAHKWLVLSVSNIKPVIWHHRPFDDLIIADETKEVLQAMVSSTIANRQSHNLKIAARTQHGVNLLFHGGHGTGKTFAAESIAELIQKPLYRVDLLARFGTGGEMQNHLREIAMLSTAWDCVVLFENADSATREPHAMAMVVEFMEEFKGILILIIRASIINKYVIQSRINFATHFQPLGPEQRTSMWKKHLVEMVQNDVANDELLGYVDKLADIRVNGREIHNIVSSAQKLASFKNTHVTYEMLLGFSDVSNGFKMRLPDENSSREKEGG